MEMDMTCGNPMPVILRFTLPLLIGNIFQQLYNMADTVIVGHFVGANALAAVGSTGTIMFLVIGFAQGLSTGFTVLTSQKFGAKDRRGTKGSVTNGIFLSAVASVIITTVSLLCMRPLLQIMNTPKEIFEDAYSYIRIICIGTAVSVFYNLFSSYLRAVGNSRVPLIFLVFSAALNVALDLVCIIIFRLGSAGAAIATDISQGISAVLCIIYIYLKVPVLRPEKTDWHIRKEYIRHQLRIGIPMALQFGITASGTMIMQSAVNLFGATAVMAYTAAGKLQNLIMQGMISMGQTMAAFTGQNYGQHNLKRISLGIRCGIKTMIVYSTACSVFVCLMYPYVLRLFFSSDVDISAMLPWAGTYLNLCAIFYIPLSFIFLFRNTMQGCSYALLPMLGGVVELVARSSMAVVSIHSMRYILACACDPAAWLCTGVFAAVSYLYVMRDMKKRIHTEPA